jgi:hypothetical protein
VPVGSQAPISLRKHVMKKENLKTESHYNIIVKVKGNFESVDIVQEENIKDRNAINVEFFKDRWRTLADTVELFKKIIIVLEENF